MYVSGFLVTLDLYNLQIKMVECTSVSFCCGVCKWTANEFLIQ